MKSKILVFSATYNESENINNFLDSIEKLNLELDLLLIDDNSPDKTWEKIKKRSEHKKNIKLIIRDKKAGLDTAHKIAYEYGLKNDYNFLITLDADLSHDASEIPNFINELKLNPFVIGSRYMKGGGCGMEGFRLFLSLFGNRFMKFIFNINCNEFTSAFRGFNLKDLGNFHLNNVESEGYSFFMETVYLIYKNGISIKQIPIYFSDRKKGKSKIPKMEIFRTLFNVFRLKLKKNT